ncbi:MAG: ATP-binding cassette domain-containing protein [Campylobacter sp.]|nr:ATP-binding cassette domain-containing protein [Campylobacter sp.]
MLEVNIQKPLHGANGDMNLDAHFSIQKGDFLALAGVSGSGKTTLLRCLAGLEKSVGTIRVGDEIWQDEKTFLPPQKRSIGFVFQDYALFGNLSVEKNFLFANKDKKLCSKLLDILGLIELKDRYPSKLSGGQKQRVSLGRAMMREPKILLLDEPLSALDPSLRVKLQDEILNIHEEFGTTSIIVSHSPSEIYKLTNYMLELKDGKIIREGKPKDLLLRTSGSQKFSFSATVVDLKKTDSIYIATISLGQQITQVVIPEIGDFKVGDRVNVSTKAFNLLLSKGEK